MTCLHTEKWASSSCFLCLFNVSHKVLTKCSVPLNLHFVPLTQSIALMFVFILSHFCHWRHSITHTFCVQTHTHTHTQIQGCSAHFSSLMGYQYHQQRCGREYSDDAKPVFLCQHCGKNYRSKAGRDYHVRTEHSPATTMTAAATTNLMDSITDTNNNTGKERVRSFLEEL